MKTLRLRVGVPVAALVAIHLAATDTSLAQQPANLPRPSPDATVSQMVGVTKVSIQYSSPGVMGRKIWGDLVPYGEVWRTGANENTTLTFSTPVKINGSELPAGTYGLQTLPTQEDWTVILSKDADLWGAFKYKPENDALRFQVTPQTVADSMERMAFTFEDTTDTSSNVVLRWEKLRVSFKIEVDTPKLFLDTAKEALRWQPLVQAANYCVQNNICLDEASRWVDASIALQENFSTLRAKAMLLAKKNDTKSAAAYGERALAAAKTAQQAPNAQQLKELQGLVTDWKKGK